MCRSIDLCARRDHAWASFFACTCPMDRGAGPQAAFIGCAPATRAAQAPHILGADSSWRRIRRAPQEGGHERGTASSVWGPGQDALRWLARRYKWLTRRGAFIKRHG